MKTISAAIAGFLIQAMGLSAFVAIANGAWASPGKQIVIVITVLSMATLLFFANRPYTLERSIMISALLAAGYLVAYHLLGINLFPGLLKDLRVPSIGYLQAISSIFGILFTLYFLGSAVIGLLNRLLSRSRQAQTS